MAASLGIFLKMDVMENFMFGIMITDGAEEVWSFRTKDLYWQYGLEKFSPKGLNE